MTLDAELIAQLAQQLYQQHRERAAFAPLNQPAGIPGETDAYAIQHAFLACHEGRSMAGYKVGLTSKRMQQMCHYDSPIAGHVLADTCQSSPLTLSLSDYTHLGIEFEIAVRLGRDLPHARSPYEMNDIAEAIDGVAPAIEIIDDRGADYDALDILSLVADNSWNQGLVLGEFSDQWPELDALRGEVSLNQAVVDSGCGADVLGHPFASVLWLANHRHATHDGLHAGDLIATGSLVTTRFPSPGERYRYELGALGALEIAFE